jgi:hypothetical protein
MIYTKNPKEIVFFYFFKKNYPLMIYTKNHKEIFFFYFFKKNFLLKFYTKNPHAREKLSLVRKLALFCAQTRARNSPQFRKCLAKKKPLAEKFAELGNFWPIELFSQFIHL